MAPESENDLRLEIGHVLFIDLVGYSKLLIEEQKERLDQLTNVVLATAQVREATNEQLVRLPTGDGMALVFRNNADEPVRCALEIAELLRKHPEVPVRMGIHSGPVSEVTDVSGRTNIAGAGINIAQRVMDCGDAGHILLSKHVADDLEHYQQWRPLLHDLGECEVKHGVRLSVVNLYTDGRLGNPEVPENFRKAQQTQTASIKRARPSFVAIISVVSLIAVAIAAVIFAFLIFRSRENAPRKNSDMANERPTAAIPDKSIAVLPFENLSEDKANAYFADGIQEEILTRLSKIGDLKVISRTSTQHYKTAPENLPEIAKLLGVANIVEGSVQKSGDTVRVNVQLIKAANDSHLWADTYDRKLTDLFVVESEIAQRIADTLQAKLTGAEQQSIAARPTQNTEAHQLYLKGRYFLNKATGDEIKRAIDYFHQAISADGRYAIAYTGLTDAYLLLPYFTAGTPQECYPKAKDAAQTALQLEDKLADAHIAFAQVLQFYDFNYAQAEVEFRRGLDLDPNNANGHWRYSWLLAALGRSNEAFAEIKRALELDPLSLIINTDLGYFYAVAGRYDEAITQLHRTIEMEPNFFYAHGTLGIALTLQGRFSEALNEYKKTQELSDDPYVLALLAQVYAASGDQGQARKYLSEMQDVARRRYVQNFAFAFVYTALGERGEALRLLEQSYRDRAGNDLATIRVDPFLAPLRGDPRFEKLADSVLGGGSASQ